MSNILSIVVPAYNEEDAVAAVIDRTLAIEPELRKLGLDGMEIDHR